MAIRICRTESRPRERAQRSIKLVNRRGLLLRERKARIAKGAALAVKAEPRKYCM